MADFEFIMRECRKVHFTQWDETVLENCMSLLPNLTREQLFALYRCKWLVDRDPLKQAVFKVLFADKIGKREERIKNLDIDGLIEEFKDRKSGNIALVRKELRERYKAGKDKQKIVSVFNVSTKSDQQWVKSQLRKERYGDSYGNGYQWNKPSWK